MRLGSAFLLPMLLASGPTACGASAPTSEAVDDAGATGTGAGSGLGSDSGSHPEDARLDEPVDDVHTDASGPHDAAADTGPTDAHAAHDAAPDGPACIKHLTVLFSVGTGAGSLASHAHGCWDVLDADGSANPAFRKCSTSSWIVHNPGAPNYAFDDSNPNAPLAQDQSFLQQCAAGATGVGFEYLAYRGGWRLLFPATHLKAFFAELYSTDDDVDDDWPGAYVGNAQLAKHTVYPMINIGPRNDPSPEGKIKSDGLAICKTIADGGYFGVYVGAWDQPMGKGDPRIVALSDALDACTIK